MKHRQLFITALVAPLTVLGASVAYGDSDNAAQVVREDGSCSVYVLDDDGNVAGFTTARLHAVNRSNGGRTLVCHAKNVDVPATKTVQTTGFLCNAYGVFTTDTRHVQTKTGNIHLTCFVKG